MYEKMLGIQYSSQQSQIVRCHNERDDVASYLYWVLNLRTAGQNRTPIFVQQTTKYG